MNLRRHQFVSACIFSGIFLSQGAYSQTITFDLKQLKSRSFDSACSLFFEVTNHTSLNITSMIPEFLLKYSDGLVLDNVRMNERIRPNAKVAIDTGVYVACNQIGSIEFVEFTSQIFKVEGSSLSTSELDNIIDGIQVISSIQTVTAP